MGQRDHAAIGKAWVPKKVASRMDDYPSLGKLLPSESPTFAQSKSRKPNIFRRLSHSRNTVKLYWTSFVEGLGDRRLLLAANANRRGSHGGLAPAQFPVTVLTPATGRMESFTFRPVISL
jgi:hypothetical protein